MSKVQAIIMKPSDNVCTVVVSIPANSNITVSCEDNTHTLFATDNIPAGHKAAIENISIGDKIFKYGEVIGLATKNIKIGEHVHVHNIESCRGRGDK